MKDQFVSFIDALSSHVKGEIILINMFFTLKNSLIDKSIFNNFLNDCCTQYMTHKDALDVFNKVVSGHELGANNYLRKSTVAKQSSQFKKIYLNTVLTREKFRMNFVNDNFKTMAEFPRIPNKKEIEKFNDIFNDPKNDWREDITIGILPSGIEINTWVSSFDIVNNLNWTSEHHSAIIGYPSYTNMADKARDERGLIEYNEEDDLVQLIFPISGLERDHKIVRPIFSDGGNTRFLVYHGCVRQDDWGMSTHLGKLRDFKSYNEFTGACEMVIAPVKLKNIKNLKIEYLGGISRCVDCDDNEFIKKLYTILKEYSVYNLCDIKRELLNYLD